ncbi:hypothetical protein J6590_092455 [Homalodisca vitripennis]|nr:hypothetical protein J6590_092455 [Homalodisca vitripennis]
MPQNRRVELPDCRVLLRRMSTEEIGNYLAVRDVRIAVNERPNNEAEINIVLPRGNNVNINDIVNPRENPPRRVLPPMRRHADVPHRVTYRSALLYGAESVENVPISSLGRFQVRCRICDAKYFSEESCNLQGLYMQCCNLGKVEIPALGPCPEELRGFLTGEDAADVEFRRNIRTMGNWKPSYKVITNRVLLVTDSHGRELHHLLESSSDYSLTAIVSPNGTLNYIADNALLYQETYDEVIVMAGTNDISDKGYVNNDFFNALGKLIKLSKLNNLTIINLPRRRDTVSPAVHRTRASLNASLKNIKSVNFIDISNFKRDFFTSHGLHMNMHGKHELAAVILNCIGDKSEKKNLYNLHEQVRRIRRPKN